VELARQAGGIVLPPLFLGPDRREMIDGKMYYGMDMSDTVDNQPCQLDGSAYWIDDESFVQLLELILSHLVRAGFKIVVAHGHGPSNLAFAAHIDEWSKQLDLKLFTCWRDEETDGMGVQTDHAAANETSLVMALRPELVQMGNLSADLNDKPVAVGGKDPRTDASRPTGQQIVRQHVDRMTKMLRQALAAT
ncbi:MAG: creatininase family protein, partial [Phycisphaeraceae bacterium]|nr:creatininase family protein [Phycisphaeraceae bacterium]